MGHVISKDGISIDPQKIETVVNWSRPVNMVEVHNFLGLAGYYRRFVKDLSKIVTLLTQLTRKKVPFVWKKKCEDSLLELKNRLVITPILAIPSGSGDLLFIVMLLIRD